MTTREKILSVIFLIVLTLGGYYHYSHNKYMEKQYAQAVAWATNKDETAKKYIDDNNNMHDKINTLSADRDAFIKTNKEYVDSIAKLNKIKSKNITSITTVATHTDGKIIANIDTNTVNLPIATDKTTNSTSIKVRPVNYEDRWIKLNGFVGTNKLYATYSYTDSLIYVGSQKRSGFLGMGRMKAYLDVSSNNPNTIITNARSIQLTKIKDYKWSLGPYAGYGYDGNKWSPSLGISVQYSLFKF